MKNLSASILINTTKQSSSSSDKNQINLISHRGSNDNTDNTSNESGKSCSSAISSSLSSSSSTQKNEKMKMNLSEKTILNSSRKEVSLFGIDLTDLPPFATASLLTLIILAGFISIGYVEEG
eukprot:13591_1